MSRDQRPRRPGKSGPAGAGRPARRTLACRVAVREGEEGADLAAGGRVAVLVDALRASATLCSLLEAGVREVLVAAEVETCLALAASVPGTVTVGERGGRRVDGFDLGNSPLEARRAELSGRTAVMTTTTGALRLVSAQGSPALFVGGPRNLAAAAEAAAGAAQSHHADIVVIAAGTSGGAAGMAVEDLASASLIAARLAAMGATLDPGGAIHVPPEALPDLFRNCPNGRHLKALGYAADVPYCAEIDRTTLSPFVADGIDLPGGDVAAVVRSHDPKAARADRASPS